VTCVGVNEPPATMTCVTFDKGACLVPRFNCSARATTRTLPFTSNLTRCLFLRRPPRGAHAHAGWPTRFDVLPLREDAEKRFCHRGRNIFRGGARKCWDRMNLLQKKWAATERSRCGRLLAAARHDSWLADRFAMTSRKERGLHSIASWSIHRGTDRERRRNFATVIRGTEMRHLR